MKRNKYVVEETRFDYKGYPCVVLFVDMGHRCGYIGIPRKSWKPELEDAVDCHGGVTYCKSHLNLQDDTDKFWIGFDTAHFGDGKDLEKVKEYFGEETLKTLLKWSISSVGDSVCTLDYCIEQCKSMVDQTIEFLAEKEGLDESN